VIAGGVESMSMVAMGGNKPIAYPGLMKSMPNAYAAMGTTADGTVSLSLRDTTGSKRIAMSVLNDGISFALFGDKGQPQVSLGAAKEHMPGLSFYDKRGQTTLALLGITPNQSPIMVFKNKDGEIEWTAGENVLGRALLQ